MANLTFYIMSRAFESYLACQHLISDLLQGKTETKQVVNRILKWVEESGNWKGHESGQAVLIFLTASPLVCAHFAVVCAASPLSSAPDKTAMLRKVNTFKTKPLSFQLKGIPKDFKPIPTNCDTAP